MSRSGRLASGVAALLDSTRSGGRFLDHVRRLIRLRHHHDVRPALDLDHRPRLRALRHEAMDGRRDVPVLRAEEEPGRDRLPGRPRAGLVQRGLRDGALRRRHNYGVSGRHVGRKLGGILVLLDVEILAAVGKRHRRGERRAEGAAGKAVGQRGRALPRLRREARDEHQRLHVRAVADRAADHVAAVRVPTSTTGPRMDETTSPTYAASLFTQRSGFATATTG